jgi:hypothetical protein
MKKTIAILAALVALTGPAMATGNDNCRGGKAWCEAQQQSQSQGQSQGQSQSQKSTNINSNSAKSSSSSSAGAVSVTSVSISSKAVAAAAAAYANAPATANPCALSAGAGYQERVFGISFSFSYEADECEVIRAADALQRHGQFKAALIMLCTDPRAVKMGNAMRQAGTCVVRRTLSHEPVFTTK